MAGRRRGARSPARDARRRSGRRARRRPRGGRPRCRERVPCPARHRLRPLGGVRRLAGRRHGGAWQIDFERLRGTSLEEDLALRDFTVNAIAEPLERDAAGGAPGVIDTATLIDPLGGLEDLRWRRLRAAGPRAFAEDPLRVLRLVRMAVELDFALTPETQRSAAGHAEGLRGISPERVFMELRQIVAAPRAQVAAETIWRSSALSKAAQALGVPASGRVFRSCRMVTPRAVAGIELMSEIGASAVVLPELVALQGVEQSRYHHRDVYGHTLEVLEQTIALSDGSGCGRTAGVLGESTAAIFAEHGPALAALLAEPLADELTRGEALRWGALLHDIAKPPTRQVIADPRAEVDRHVTFIGHDRLGAQLAREILGRLRASGRLCDHISALVRNHLRLGFLVHEPQPLARRSVFAYLRTCEPVEVDVTLLSVADRLATRGARSEEAIDAHLQLARAILGDALRWRSEGAPATGWRGDELARALDIAPGPRLGELLEELSQASYAGEIASRAQALQHARRVLETLDTSTIGQP